MNDEELWKLIGKERYYRERVSQDAEALKVALPIAAVLLIMAIIFIGV